MTPTKVMLVDDEKPFVEAVSKRLDKRGCKIIAAYSGEEAMTKLNSKEGANVDVVLLDVKMPGMDGNDTLKAIKQAHPLIEVIMLTGHGTMESAIEGMRQGAFDYMTKPAEMDILAAKIEQASSKKRGHEAKIQEARAQMIVTRRGD
ncbi:MAG: response regulator [Proteobacteria bacterium]|nr:response regulator [Pseudomonadota bacterium]